MSRTKGMTAARGHVQLGGSFDILEDECFHLIDLESPPIGKLQTQSPLSPAPAHPYAQTHSQVAQGKPRPVLEELRTDVRLNNESCGIIESSCPVEKAHQQSAAFFNEAKSAKAKVGWRASRSRRPVIESETFEPLDAVLEESSLVEIEPCTSPKTVGGGVEESESPHHILTTVDTDCDTAEQVEKHLAGQFEWVFTYQELPSGHDDGGMSSTEESVIYGCNFLRRNRRGDMGEMKSGKSAQANVYAFLATPLKLKTNGAGIGQMDRLGRRPTMAHFEPPPPYPGSPLRVPEILGMIEKTMSPSHSVMSMSPERSDSGLSRDGSRSSVRIEDSLEEIDKLDKDIEAVSIAALSRGFSRLGLDQAHSPKSTPKTPTEQNGRMSTKRTPTLLQSATMRVKPSEKARPSLRRSSSLTFRDNKAAAGQAKETKVLAGSKAGGSNTGTPKSGAKSTKPTTVARFELPGEAVSRRLKEQRDARKAQQQQVEAQRTPAASISKAKVSRAPLAKPTFELPGEAISRRKREEREAKLQAEEEAERRRREFKARPVRQSAGPVVQPRDTAASRARMNRSSQDESSEADRSKRASLSRRAGGAASSTLMSHAASMATKSPCTGSNARSSTATGGSTRATSVVAQKRLMAADEMEQQRQRGRETVARDGDYGRDKEREHRERETAARLAREQTAERSSMAIRQWAERKRRQEGSGSGSVRGRHSASDGL